MLAFERNRRELSETPAARLDTEMKEVAAFLAEYLLAARTPAEIAAHDAGLGEVWRRLTGTSGDSHYGRPVAFHHQAQRQDWAAAWGRLRAPALVLFGEYDWFEEVGGHALIERIVRRTHPAHTRLRVLPKTDHHFMRYRTPEDAYLETGGAVVADEAVDEILGWLRELLRG